MKKGERPGHSRSQARKGVTRSESGIRSVRQEAKKSPDRHHRPRQESNGRRSWSKSDQEDSWNDWSTWSHEKAWEDWDSSGHWKSWSFAAEARPNEMEDRGAGRGDRDDFGRTCDYFQAGYCHWGSSCYFSHDWMEQENAEKPSELAALVFILDSKAAEVMHGPSWCNELTTEDTGPMRVRLVGDFEDLQAEDGETWDNWDDEMDIWDPNLGIDLHWEGDSVLYFFSFFFFFFNMFKSCCLFFFILPLI